MPIESNGQAKGKDCGVWKPHLAALAASLEATNGVDLLEVKAKLASLLGKVNSRIKSQGGGSLVERMALAASSATTSLSVQDAQRLLAGMTAKLRIRVDRADPCRGLVSASCAGTWGLFGGQSFSFKASVKDVLGKVTGQIKIEGLGFTSTADLSTGKFDCDAKALIRTSGLNISESDALRAVVVGLEFLARRKVAGIADVDVLSVAFGLMRTSCGLQASGEAVEESSDGEAESEGEMDEEDDDAEPDELRSEQSEPVEDEEVAEEENEEEDGNEGEEEEKSEEDKSSEKDEDEAEEDPTKASDDDASVDRLLPTRASDSEEEEKSEKSIAGDDDGNNSVDDDREKVVSEVEDDDTTVFVSRKAFKAVKDKLDKSKVPTLAELTRLADWDSVPDGEDVVCIDSSVLGATFTAQTDRKEAVKALVAEHGLKGSSELFVKAEEAAGVELGDDEGEEEESEGDEEEHEEEIEAPSTKAASPKASAAKAPQAKIVAANAPVANKAAAAKAPAGKAPPAKRARLGA